MKKLLTYLLSAMMIFAVGCSEAFDDTAIWEKLNSLESRVAALEQLCKQMNTNITSLQSIVEALQNKDYVTSVAPITEDGKTIGYTITFSKSGAVTIYHGKDGKDGQNGANGKDGYTPTIGVAKASDGKYYWTLDGNWLTDNYGNKIKAEAQDGADGITPKLKIENDYWYISYDNGKTWTELGKATGEDGDSMFQDVTYDDNYVYITLIDGTRVAIPCREVPAANEIWYTSSDGKIVTPYSWNSSETKIVSNVYKDGKGVITFDNNIHGISSFAFYKCIKLTSITIPDGVTQIGECAFDHCSSLTSVNIPDSVTQIGDSAFRYCSSLISIIIPKGVTKLGEFVFSECSNLISITFNNNPTILETGLFNCCFSLINITIPNSVTSIGADTFRYCESLTYIYIPEGVTSIGDSAFEACSNLTSFTFPKSITNVGSLVFYNNCSKLKTINCKAANPPSLGRKPFQNITRIYVPMDWVDSYKAADSWSDYADKIVGYDF